MEKLSRVKKYARLREELMNDAEAQVASSELSPFAARLNRIDAAQFDKMDSFEKQEHDPVHLRREAYFDHPESSKEAEEETASMAFNNEYLDEYINEVKQYNKDHGYLTSENTAKNILNGIKKEPDYQYISSLDEIKTEPSYEETTEIPAFGQKLDASTISMEVKNLLETDAEKDIQTESQASQTKDVDLSKVSSAGLTFIPSMDELQAFPNQEQTDKLNTVEEELKKEKQLREKLMNETVQMRSQLEGYDKELSEVNDSVTTANRILNVVLIILILAMLVVGGVLFYWILLDRGVI